MKIIDIEELSKNYKRNSFFEFSPDEYNCKNHITHVLKIHGLSSAIEMIS
jgi:hypothetical protein